MKVLKKIIMILLIELIIFGGIIVGYKMFFKRNNIKDNKKTEIIEPKYTFINYGIVKKKADLYVKDEQKYREVGTIEEGVRLNFVGLEGKYLEIEGFDKKYYIDITFVDESDSKVEFDLRYKNYILFNENIVTDDETNFYDEDGNKLFTFHFSYDLPIIIKDTDRYGVEFHNQLLYVNGDDVKEFKESNNTDKKNTSGVGVLNYHFFYDDASVEDSSKCNQEICQSKSQFQSELDYLKDNNFFTITTQELEWYIDGKVNLPKSVLITIDDGWMMELGLQMLEENKMNACVFLITSWFEDLSFKNNYEYIEFQSHGEELHSTGVCPGGQGGAIKCLEKNKLLEDLKISSNKLGGSTVLAYPFYEYNNYSIEVLKEAGYTMAFAGESSKSDNLVHVGSDKYRLPRFVMVNYTTKSDLDKYFGNIE